MRFSGYKNAMLLSIGVALLLADTSCKVSSPSDASSSKEVILRNSKTSEAKVLYADNGLVYLKTCQSSAPAAVNRDCPSATPPKELAIDDYFARLPGKIAPYKVDKASLDLVNAALAAGPGPQDKERLQNIKERLTEYLKVLNQFQDASQYVTEFEFNDSFTLLLVPFNEQSPPCTCQGICRRDGMLFHRGSDKLPSLSRDNVNFKITSYTCPMAKKARDILCSGTENVETTNPDYYWNFTYSDLMDQTTGCKEEAANPPQGTELPIIAGEWPTTPQDRFSGPALCDTLREYCSGLGDSSCLDLMSRNYGVKCELKPGETPYNEDDSTCDDCITCESISKSCMEAQQDSGGAYSYRECVADSLDTERLSCPGL